MASGTGRVATVNTRREESMALDMGGSMFGKKKPKAAATLEPARAKPPPKTVMIERPDREREGGAMRLMDRLLSFRLPLIGDKPINTQVQVLLILLGFSFFVTVAVLVLDNRMAANNAVQTEIVGDTLMHTQRLAKAAPNSVGGGPQGFAGR
jgi:twitching motility protein PilJ